MPELGRLLLVLGVLLVGLGLLLFFGGRLALSLGHLPGDLHWRGRNWSLSLPLATSLLLSLLLSLIVWAVSRFR